MSKDSTTEPVGQLVHPYPSTIPAAARLLDSVNPNWYKEINTNRLNMKLTGGCILGQLYKEYSLGMEQLFGFGKEIPGNISFDKVFGSKADPASWYYEINERFYRPAISSYSAETRNPPGPGAMEPEKASTTNQTPLKTIDSLATALVSIDNYAARQIIVDQIHSLLKKIGL